MRIGILGGTFDPIHCSHIGMALAAREQLGLDKVLFVVAGNPPHKKAGEITPAEHRFAMTKLALEQYPCLEASDLELRRQEVCYTYDTVLLIEKQYPEAELTFLLGSDMLRLLPGWRNGEELIKRLHFAVMSRPGEEERDRESIQALVETHGARVTLLKGEPEMVSSTEIRTRIRNCLPVRGMMPVAAEIYCYEHGLYLDEELNHLRQQLEPTLSRERYRHTMGVVSQAACLADAYAPGDSRLAHRAALAALLHDCAKELPKARLGVLSGDDFPEIGAVQHALAGAVVARSRYGITDDQVLRAIRLHCTGDAGMGLLDIITYLADLTEPCRDYPVIDNYRKALALGPDGAMAAALRGQMAFMEGKACHPATLRAYERYCNV